MATVRKRQLELQRRLEENRKRAEAEDFAKRQAEAAEHIFKSEVETPPSKATTLPVEAGTENRDGRPVIEKLSAHCRSIAKLLNTRSLEDVLQAFDMIESSRQISSLSKVDNDSFDWFEAECWRRYAAYQAEHGELSDAIHRCLEEAIKLTPTRGELYLDRARWRSQLACPRLQTEGRLLSQVEVHGARCVLADANQALALDNSLADAYDLAVQVLIALGDLSAAEKLAKRGELTVADPLREASPRRTSVCTQLVSWFRRNRRSFGR